MDKVYKLKFDNSEQFQSLCFQLDVNDNMIPAAWMADVITIREIGTITKGGKWDEEGNVITEPTVLKGYHVDVKSREYIPELNEHIVWPPPEKPVHGKRWQQGCEIVEPIITPTADWTKTKIQDYLTNNGITWKQSWNKAQLLAAV